MNRIFFPASLCLSACLLFIIQPMVAKVLLPVYGGTPAVWTVCMLFFQILLLIAYGYAWMLSRFQGRRTWRVIHLSVCLLSLAVLPLTFVPVLGEGIPELQILENLLFQLGLPLLVIGASAPLLQYAYSQTKAKQAADPYFLYVASNAGSLFALLSYPWLVERFSGVNQQFYSWNIIYLVYLGLLLYLLCVIRYEPNVQMVAVTAEKTPWQTRARWIFLSFIPCSFMLGVTFYITTDIAATPLFWVLPLTLYLLSFMMTFARKPMISQVWLERNSLFFLLFPILGFIIDAHLIGIYSSIITNLVGFFMMALLCHGELVRIRPPVRQLPLFYFCLALGGVLAGLFNGIVAPRLFSHAYEYPLIMLLALTCIPFRKMFRPLSPSKRIDLGEWFTPSLVLVLLGLNYALSEVSWIKWLDTYHLVEVFSLIFIMLESKTTRSLFLGMAVLFAFIFIPWFKPTVVLSQQRNFYGVKQVFSLPGTHVLMSQNTIHGFQVKLEGNPTDGTRAYYGSILPVVQRLQNAYQPLHAMVLGLGTGIMACQFRNQDKLTIVEIDDQVIDIATNPALFTYLRDCPPKTALIKDDGLLAVKRAPDQSYELLVMDAFNSDSVPVHLLTLEAFAIYKQKIIPEGVILVNISNRYMRILPVLTGAGRALDMIVLFKSQATNNHLGQLAAEWALLTTNERLASTLLGEPGWHFVTDSETQLWTNNYSNIIPLLKWHL